MLKLSGIIAVGLSLLAANAAQAEQTKFTVLYAATSGMLASYVAADQHLYEKHGLDVTMTLLGSQGSVIAAELADSAQIGTATPLQVIQAQDSGIDAVLLASTNVSPTQGRTGIFARKGEGIKTPQDLIGKKVGVPSLYTFLHVLARHWLQVKGVDYNKVGFAEISFQQMADGLKSGIVDAVDCIDPYYDRVAAVGDLIGDPDEILPTGTLTSVYTSTRDWADKNPNTVIAFRAALQDAIAFINDPAKKDAVYASLGKYTKQPTAIVMATPLPKLQLPIVPQQVQYFIDLARDQGLIKNNIDAAKLIVPMQ